MVSRVGEKEREGGKTAGEGEGGNRKREEIERERERSEQSQLGGKKNLF